MLRQDVLQRFMFGDGSVRGVIVRLRASYRAVASCHPYPSSVEKLLGESLVACALMSATIKYKGSLSLQLQGDGPVRFMVAQCDDEYHLRGLAKCNGKLTQRTFNKLMGKGHLAITIEPEGGQRYQGVVPLEGKNIAGVLEAYFSQSEQLPTCLFLTADKVSAAGILLQRVPGVHATRPDFWNEIVCLTRTLTAKELLKLPTNKILTRLFHEVLAEQDVAVFETEPVSFRCRCSQERIENTLRALPHDEVMSLVDEQNLLSIVCEFCQHCYRFDPVDVKKILTTGIVSEGGQTFQ